MRRIDHRGEILDAVHAEIGHRRGAALIFLGLQLARPRARREILHLGRDRRQRFGLGVADDRRDQAAGHRHRDADIGMLVLEHAAFGPAHIAVGNPLQRDRHRLDDEVVDRELVERLLFLVLWRRGVDLLARREQLADVAIHRQVEMRNGLHRSGQPLRDGAAHAVMRDDLVAARFEQRAGSACPTSTARSPARRRRRRCRRFQALAGFGVLDIARDDAAMRAGAVDARELDAGFLGEAARQRRREDAGVAVGLRRAGVAWAGAPRRAQAPWRPSLRGRGACCGFRRSALVGFCLGLASPLARLRPLPPPPSHPRRRRRVPRSRR